METIHTRYPKNNWIRIYSDGSLSVTLGVSHTAKRHFKIFTKVKLSLYDKIYMTTLEAETAESNEGSETIGKANKIYRNLMELTFQDSLKSKDKALMRDNLQINRNYSKSREKHLHN
ncbi:hypothetical protein CEXT_410321 [Caerostris extrusa]|uniref:LAGLIDADG homing endonuclease n=1 Tax=Caerostris extrusa TaxID=172846 RepID=A0AAV4UM24_CAEEX|nr:hypothetical protein CEXT_410321 [Caerostris extrusa]